MRGDKRTSLKSEAKGTVRGPKRGVVGYSRKTALLEEAITQMNAGKYGRSSSALKELLALDPQNMEARRLFATLHLRLGSLIPARQAFDTLITEAFQRQDYWLAESLLREYLAAGPRCVPFLEKLGVIYQEKGDVQEAIAEYGKAIDILIEDPDLDNPHLVSQLYKKVRELAPASPIAIRLASFFDTQTGELIARGPSLADHATQPPITTTDHHAIPEPASGVMPWDIDTPQGDGSDSVGTISSRDGSTSLAPPHAHEALLKAVTARGQSELSGPVQMQAQPDHSLGGQTPAQSPELTHQDNAAGVLSVHEENRAPVPESSPDTQAGVRLSALPAEARAGMREPGAAEAEDHSSAAQEVVEPTQRLAEGAFVCTGESSVVQQTTTDQSSAANRVTALTQETESAAAIQGQGAGTPVSEAVSTGSEGAAGTHTEPLRDLPVPGSSGHVSPQRPVEPWKEPGFSWESLFDRAWNFGTLPSGDSVSQAATLAKSEAPTSSDSSPNHSSPIESESIQIPERGEHAALVEEAVSTGSMRPLPWDQIQESVLPIPPVEAKESQGEGGATTEGQSIATVQDKSQAEYESVERTERVASDPVAVVLTAVAPVSLMPSDHIQDSAIPIPPPELEESSGEGIAAIEGLSGSLGKDMGSIESAAVKIPERTDHDAIAVELTSTSSVKSLPWDQIQESALLIPPVEVQESQGEGATTPERHASPIGEDTAPIEHAVVEILERTDHDAIAVDLTSTGSVKSLPWDQIQESALLIPPVEVQESQGEGATTPERHASPIGEDTAPIEHAVIEIPEQTDRDAVAVDLTDTGSVRPLPWDQIEESALPIPPAQIEEFHEEGMVATGGQSSPIGEDKPSIENIAKESPERPDRDVIPEELTSTGSVRSLPWDQIQESGIPIPPAEAEKPRAAVGAITEELSGSTIQSESQSENEVIEVHERVDHRVEPEELTDTVSSSPLPSDQIQASNLPIPIAPSEELDPEEMASTAEQETSAVGAGEVADVVQDLVRTSEALSPASEEIGSLSEGTASGISLPSESDVPLGLIDHSAQETSRSEIRSAAPATGSRSDEAHPQAGATLPAAFAQTDEVDQSLPLRLHDAQDGERESVVPQSPDTREGAAERISASEQPPTRLSSGTKEAAPVEVGPAASLSLVEESRRERGEGTLASQAVATEESRAALSLVPESSPVVPQRQVQESMTAPSVEREVVSAAAVKTFSSSSSFELAAPVQSHDDRRQDDLTSTETVGTSLDPAVQQEEWAKTSESIRFVEASPEVSSVAVEPEQAGVASVIGMVADDTRVMSSRNVGRDASQEQRVEAPSRLTVRAERRKLGVAIQDFIGSCFSTTRAIVATGVGLILLGVIAVAAGIGMISLTWLSMEEGPSPAYQSFTTIPQQTLSDVKRNGYFLLVGFDAPAQVDPIRAGYEGKIGTDQVATGRACLGDPQGSSGQQSNASASVSKSWFRSADPVGQVKAHGETVRGWVSQQSSALSRYGRWPTLPFEDWGYGQTGGLPCASIVFAHELYLADGFLQALEEGVERLETDMEAWRIVLGQARTLPVKALALQAMNDDIAVASGLLVRADFDSKYLGRLSKMLRPLDQAELSIRWPMQSELVVASKTYEAQVKAAKAGDQSLYAAVASMLSLPKQRRLNDYAEYYEASYRAVGEGHHSTLPQWKDYIRNPAAGLSDYMANPIENIVGLEALPPWDQYHGQVMDTEARLRLASLQAWLRRGPTDGDVLTRLAKAGQKFYDPYTGLPMLVNMKKAALYSVGHDGKDQDADPQFDVVVTLPAVQPSSSHASSKSSAESSKP